MKKFTLLTLLVMMGVCSEKAQSEGWSGKHMADHFLRETATQSDWLPEFGPGPVIPDSTTNMGPAD